MVYGKMGNISGYANLGVFAISVNKNVYKLILAEVHMNEKQTQEVFIMYRCTQAVHCCTS